MSEEHEFNIGDLLDTFGSNQQKISMAETKIVQLKRAIKHKEDIIEQLLQEQTALQNDSYDLRRRESAVSIEVDALKEANNSMNISKSNAQLNLSKKERLIAELKENHRCRIKEKIKEIDEISGKLLLQRSHFKSKCRVVHDSDGED